MPYQPQEDSHLLEREVRKLAKARVLDMGTGRAVQAIAAAEKASEVIAVDIDKKAIDYCKKNIKNKKIKFIKSDLFKNIKGKFDTIIFNPPYLPQDKGIDDPAIYGGKKGWEIIERFLKNVSEYLTEKGIILLLFSSLTNKKKVDEIIKDNLLQAKSIAKSHQFFEDLFVYKITKTSLLNSLEQKGISEIHYFAKGKRGIIYEGKYKNKSIVIKIPNPKSEAIERIENEVYWLKLLNKKDIGPKIVFTEKNLLVMEKIKGPFLREFLETANKKDMIKVINSVLDQCHVLDKMGVNKEEMHRPYKHIIIQNKKPFLIDFERTHKTEKPQNVTQFYQFLGNKEILSCLNKKGININKKEIIGFAKEYRNTKSLLSF